MSTKQTKVKEKEAEHFFFQEIFRNSASDIEMGSFYTFFEMGTWRSRFTYSELWRQGVNLLKFHFHV